MAESVTVCPSCKKRDRGYGRYCIYCGSVLRPVYCSHCGTVNPDDLEQCLQCGNPIPELTHVRWGPIVTVTQPTSAMVDEKSYATYPHPEGLTSNVQSSRKSPISRFRAWLTHKEHPTH